MTTILHSGYAVGFGHGPLAFVVERNGQHGAMTHPAR